jgi:hypothetical protein
LSPTQRRAENRDSRAAPSGLGDSLSGISDGLDELRASLLRSLGEPLGADDGEAAFDRHILLAVRIHRAAGLNARAREGEGKAWTRYFMEHFPVQRNSKEDAEWLWREWRTRLLKIESPRGIAHGNAFAHWCPLPEGGVVVNLESMWSDFSVSVDHFVAELRQDASRRNVVLERFRERLWSIRSVPVVPGDHLFPSDHLYPGAIALSGSMGPPLYLDRKE